MIGERTAEEIKMSIGNAMVSDDMEKDFEIRGLTSLVACQKH